MLGRVLGWLFLCAGLLLAGGDIVRSLEAGATRLTHISQLWARLHEASLDRAERLLPGWAWHWLLEPLLRQPAVLVAALAGIALLFLFRPRRPRRARPTFR